MKNTNAFKASDYALVDLHLHLDGSLTPDDIVCMAAMEGVEVPNNLNELRENLTCPVHCESLNSYLKCFRLAGSVMQSRETMAYAMESNMQTKALEGVNQLSQCPLQRFLDDAIAICINTDNMTVSDTTVANELQQLHEAGILNKKQASTMLQNAIEHAFITDAEKAELKIKASQGKTN